MKKIDVGPIIPILTAFLCLVQANWAHAQGEQQYADLGECGLESGAVLLGCRLGFRTFGTLNAEGSNAVLFPTWFTGNTQALVDGNLIGPDSFIDSNRFFVIAVDALGDGISSSPSNTERYGEGEFPEVSITDMVNSQYRLLTEQLGVQELWAVVGISMGGMQTFQWMVSYPNFMEKAVAIAGTPKQTSYDLLLWSTQRDVIDALIEEPGGDEAAARITRAITLLNLWTPAYWVSTRHSDQFDDFMFNAVENRTLMRPRDRAVQLDAMINHDISAEFAGSWDRVVDTIKAQALIVVGTQDHTVNPAPALELAAALDAQVLELTGPCGHLAYNCERETLEQAVAGFLAE